MTSMHVTPAGIDYRIGTLFNSITFPIDPNKRWAVNLLYSASKDLIYELEQLWQAGYVENADHGKLLLSYDGFRILSKSACTSLGIEAENIQIRLFEKGFLGDPDYHIGWQPESDDVDIRLFTRNGYALYTADKAYKLSDEQVVLIDYIDHKPADDPAEQARYQTEARRLAKKASAAISRRLSENQSIYASSVGFDMISSDDHHLAVIPELYIPEIDEPVYLGNKAYSSQTITSPDGSGELRIICDSNTVNTYNTVAIELTNEQVPEFLDNPLRFLPENIEFDPDLFSKRVKGIKILKASAVPVININKDSCGKIDWFSVSVGLKIHDDNDNEIVLDDWSKLFPEGKSSGYVYNDGKWIYNNASVIEDYKQALYAIRHAQKSTHDGDEAGRRILEILENIDSLEYNELISEAREQRLKAEQYAFIKPALLNANLYEYQKNGYLWFLSLEKMKTGGLLADDMGLGKTLQTIAYMAHILEGNTDARFLLVMPSALTENWRTEILKFIPSIQPGSIYIHQGPYRSKAIEYIRGKTFVLTTYETLARDQILFGQIDWTLFICDETQKIKNFHTQLSNAVKGMKASQRIALTGTPVENRLSELWSIVDFVQPGLLKSYNWFRKTFERPIQEKGCINSTEAEELKHIIRLIFLRRTKDEELDLPPKHEYILPCEMTSLQESLYNDILDGVKEKTVHHLSGIQRLIQICGHPYMANPDTEIKDPKELAEQSGKMLATLKILDSIKEKREKAIIFTRFKELQQILSLVIFTKYGIRPTVINGDITFNRLGIINEFSNAEGFNIMILSPKAAGVGLNITAANHVIHYTREWNPAVENQATDRVYRIGQKKEVHVYYPTTTLRGAETVEGKINSLLNQKRELMKSIIVPANLSISEDDIYSELMNTTAAKLKQIS